MNPADHVKCQKKNKKHSAIVSTKLIIYTYSLQPVILIQEGHVMIRMSTSSTAIHKTSGPHYHCFQSDTLVWVGFKPMHTHHHAVQTYNNYSKYYLHHATCALSSLDTMSHQRASTRITRVMSINARTFTKKYRISDLNFDVSLFRLQH